MANGKRKLRDLEAPHQRRVAQWLDFLGVCWFHPPNGGNRSVVTGAILKAQGAKAGVPDIVILDPPPAQPERVGTVIELKPLLSERPSAKATPAQAEWLRAFEERGWVTAVCFGSGEAISFLGRMGYTKRTCRK